MPELKNRNLDKKTVNGFGEEWDRFNQSELNPEELKQIFNLYFSNFPWNNLPETAIGFDMGCGSGRWANFVASKVFKLYCVDASSKALNVAKENLKHHKNCHFENVSVDEFNPKEKEFDFAYSLGVLHHLPNTQDALNSCTKKLKPGGYFLLYLYSNLEQESTLYKFIWKISEFMRKIICILPFSIKKLVCDFIALTAYFPLARLSLILDRLGINTSSIPLSFYKNTSFYTMRTDALDRFGTRLEKRFSKKEMTFLMENAGLENIIFNSHRPHWVAMGRKKNNE